MPPQSSTCDFWFWRCKKDLRGAMWLFISSVTLFFFATTTLLAQSVQHLGTTQPGGMPGQPVMGGMERLANGVRVSWDGPPGYYQVYQKSSGLLAPWVA